MEKKMNTVIEYEFQDGTTTEMTLTFHKLYQLRNKNKNLYYRYNDAMNRMPKPNSEELDSITILYTAYVCAHMDEDEENLMSEVEFMIKCGSDRKEVARAARELTQPKKPKDSENRSKDKQKRENQ